MSDDKDRKAERAREGAKPAAKTVVGVPALPADGVEQRRPKAGATATSEGRASPSPPRPSSRPLRAPAVDGDRFQGLRPTASSGPPVPEKAATAEDSSTEEISASMLLPDDSGAWKAAPSRGGTLAIPELPQATPPPKLDVPSAPPSRPAAPPVTPGSLPPVTAPPMRRTKPGTGPPPAMPPASAPASQRPVTGDVEITTLPRTGLARAKRAIAKAFRAPKPTAQANGDGAERRPLWFLPAVATAGLTIGVGVVMLVVSLAHGGDEATPGRAAEPPPSASVSPVASPVPEGPPASASPAPAPVACSVSGAPHGIAPAAIVAAGVEVRSFGDDVALGFAPSDHTAAAVRLNATSLDAKGTAKARSADAIRRVTPVVSAKGALALAVDADGANDPVAGRRTVAFDPPVQLGTSEGDLVWAHPGGAVAGKLWSLGGEGDAEALRAAAEGSGDDATAVVVFRRTGAVWLGALTGGRSPTAKAGLEHVDGLGGGVGSPTVAVNDGVAIAAWADRPAPDDAWRVRWVRFRPGEAPGQTNTFAPPAGGKGEQAMAPSLAALPGRRFLLTWTEGPVSRHDVRALTLGEDGTPIGPPLDVSGQDTNAGQAQAAVNASGHGVVAFLESAGDGFRVVATPVTCP